MATILIVDDLLTDRELLGKVVTSVGHQPQFASDGEDAIARMPTLRPALVLMDVVMPRMDGFNACRKIKKTPELATTPVVLITQKNGDSDRFWGKKQGADDYLVKPYTPDQVKTMIRKFVP
jgi:twitching motility two-component system response regulator PilH